MHLATVASAGTSCGGDDLVKESGDHSDCGVGRSSGGGDDLLKGFGDHNGCGVDRLRSSMLSNEWSG